jgi:1-acyl-sn-glycerol-3-phosphate acyltransferase
MRLRGFWRLPVVAGVLLLGILWSVWHALRASSAQTVGAARRKWFRAVLASTAVRSSVDGQIPDGPALVVANHVSWLDIPVIGAAVGARFLSKHEIASWPVIGWLARRHGTVFIRRGAGELDRLINDLASALRSGDRVVVFPEATTSDGRQVLRFHPRLFEAARLAGVPVLPIALHYSPDPGTGISAAAFFGDARLAPHVWQLLQQPHSTVHVQILPVLPADGADSRDMLARKARESITAALNLPDNGSHQSVGGFVSLRGGPKP